MAYQHQRFHTYGSNALKAEEVEFDVFVKPQFLAERDRASIIDFDDARQERSAVKGTSNTGYLRTASPEQNSLPNRIASKVVHNKILGDLFASSHNSFGKKNAHRSEDLVVFAKGFSVTGLATFIMILFGA